MCIFLKQVLISAFFVSLRHKEAKLREFYEKVFPEIKKQREQTERFSR